MAFLVYFLKQAFMSSSGKGAANLKDVPRSPMVPIAHR